MNLREFYLEIEKMKKKCGCLASDFYAVRSGLLELQKQIEDYASETGKNVIYPNKPILDIIEQTEGVTFLSVAREMGMTPNQLKSHLSGEILLPCEQEEIYTAIEIILEKRRKRKIEKSKICV